MVGTVKVAPVNRLKKPDLAGFGAAGVLAVEASERMLAALEPGAEAAGVA